MFEGLLEAFEEKNAQIERVLVEKEEALAKKEEEKELLARTLAEKEVAAAKKMYSDGQSAQNIAKWLNLPIERVIEITKSLN
jgi:hypothetical protein